jgi:type II secretion system protein G
MKQRGFTLIELLVVIAIIGILSSIVIVSLTSARAKARDAKRVSELKEIQTALEVYYTNNGEYPKGCAVSSGHYEGGIWGNVQWQNILPPLYMGKMPTDPINTAREYSYYYCSHYALTGPCPPAGGMNFAYTGQSNSYILATRLEKASTTSPYSCPDGVDGWDSYKTINYILGESK